MARQRRWSTRRRPHHLFRRRHTQLAQRGTDPRVLDACLAAFRIDEDAEITLEANPGTLDLEQLRGLHAAGINRLSMGAQSFDAELLKTLGRIHSPAEIVQAVQNAREAGFTSINVDFMFGLPGADNGQWRDTLERLWQLHPEHLSLYSLIVEEGTPFHTWVNEGRITPGDEDLCADMYEFADELPASSWLYEL